MLSLFGWLEFLKFNMIGIKNARGSNMKLEIGWGEGSEEFFGFYKKKLFHRTSSVY